MRDNEKKLRVAIYMRVAQKEQCEEARAAIECQQEALEQITQSGGNVIAGRFWDYESGLVYTRPGLCAALTAVKSGQADALLMKNESRLGRDVDKNADLIAGLRRSGGRVFFADKLSW